MKNIEMRIRLLGYVPGFDSLNLNSRFQDQARLKMLGFVKSFMGSKTHIRVWESLMISANI